MQIWSIEKTLRNDDRTRAVDIRVSPDGKLFRYYENVWSSVGDDELMYYPDGGFWSCPEMSGYYGSLKDCELGARNNVKWLAGPS
jgi:hypothetical protein